MMADAADEVVGVIRCFDSEDVDLATQAGTMEEFKQRLHVLFEKRKCFELHGYTRTAMEFLESTTPAVKGSRTVLAAFGGPGSCADQGSVH